MARAGEASHFTSLESRGSQRSLTTANAPIRFSDVAHFVGLSLHQAKPPKGRLKALGAGDSQELALVGPGSREHSPDKVMSAPSKLADVGVAQATQVERYHNQLKWLRAEQNAEKDQLKRLEGSLSDAQLQQARAQRRANRQQEMWDFHQQRSIEVERQIAKLQELVSLQDKVERVSREKEAMRRTWSGAGSRAVERPNVIGTLMSGGRAASKDGREDEAGKMRPATSAGDPFPPGHDSSNQSSRGQTQSRQERNDKGSARMPKVTSSHSNSRPQTTTSGPTTSQRSEHGLQEDSEAEDVGPTLKEYFDAADALESQKRKLENEEGATDKAPAAQLSPSMRSRATPSKIPSPERERYNLSEEEQAAMAETWKQVIRRELIDKTGGPKQAFKKMDLNGSGNISLQEFADGVSRLGVDWQTITGLRRQRELFKLFDVDKDGVITFAELFPEREEQEQKRVSTPEFWNKWCRGNKFSDDDNGNAARSPKWQPSSEDELQIGLQALKTREQGLEMRKWMSATIRRLKTRGKSDARCREVVAHHLPRGTGPKDREDVQTFSSTEVKACRKAYQDQVNDPVRNIQKVVYDLREQRKTVQDFRHKLWAATVEPAMRKQMEEERHHTGQSLASVFQSAGGKKDDGTSGKADKSIAQMARESGMDEDSMEQLQAEFTKLADSKSMLVRKSLGKLLKALSPARKFADSDLDAWFDQIVRRRTTEGTSPKRGEKDKCTFEQFAVWYAHSEVRQ